MSAKVNDISGRIFGVLTATSDVDFRTNGKSTRAYWRCRCVCGQEKWVRSSSLLSGDTTSCGCNKSSSISKVKKGRASTIFQNDLMGKRFGRLTVTEESVRASSGKSKVTKWKCVCDCGAVKWVQRSSLMSGQSRSCGCLQKDTVSFIRSLEPGTAAKNLIFSQYKLRAQRKNLSFELSQNEFIEISQKPCHYCGSLHSNKCIAEGLNGEFRYNGIDRIDNELGYLSSNCVPACKLCNRAKDVMSKIDFLAWIKQTYIYNFSK